MLRALLLLALAWTVPGCASPADPLEASSSATGSGSTGAPTSAPGSDTGAASAADDTTGGGMATTGTATGEPTSSEPTSSEPTTGEPPCFDPMRCPAVCDTLAQDCPAGSKCTGVKPSLLAPYAGTACVPDNAGIGAAVGEICINADDGSDTCGPQSMCMQFGSGEGACLSFCSGTADAPACPDATVCAHIDHLWPIYLCVPACDPLAYDCPDVGQVYSAMVCAPTSPGFGCVLRGNLQGVPLGSVCADHRDCIGAARCAPASDVPGCAGAGCCAAYCDLLAPVCPLAGQSCRPTFDPGEAPPGLDDVGVCGVD